MLQAIGLIFFRLNNAFGTLVEYGSSTRLLAVDKHQPSKSLLLFGLFVHSPAQCDLYDLVVPESRPPPQYQDKAYFHPLPEITHSFRPEQRISAKVASAFFAMFVFWLWFVLLGFLRLSHRVL